MTQEEKVKAYDEAIKKAESLYKASEPMSGCNVIIETLFPELKESDNERIRKLLLYHFGNKTKKEWNGMPVKDILAWLEKQGDANKEYWRGYREGKQEILDKYAELEKQGESYTKRDVNDAYLKRITDTKNEIEKQYEASYQIRKDIATFIFNYRGDIKDRAKWMDYLGIKVSFIEKQGEQNLIKIPKFKSGDTIEFNGLGHNRYTIKDVCGTSHYINTNNARMDMSYTDDNFKLVEQKLADKIEPIEWSGKINSRNAKGVLKEMLDKKLKSEVEPKFKVGDWIVGANSVLKIISLNDELNCYIAVTPNNEEVKIPYYFDDGKGHMCSYHLWTIQDANDGDALSDGTTIFIFKDLLSDGSVMSYCDYDTDSGESDAFCPLSMNLMCSKITPATKEQRDLLFPKMKEAGYEWDAEKKELRKIEQKSVWSEEDEIMIKVLDSIIRYIVEIVDKDALERFGTNREELLSWLKSLKDRVGCEANFTTTKEWSEEDGKILNSLISSLARIGASTRTDSTSINYTFSKEIDWLKSLRPQNQWKPSDEQMVAINTAINVLGKGTLNGKQLINLREELQKLMEKQL